MLRSFLDNDKYKFLMQQAVLSLYPDVYVTYKFKSREPRLVNRDFLSYLKSMIKGMAILKLSDSEIDYIKKDKTYNPAYIEYLTNYRFNPNEIEIQAPSVDEFDLQDLNIKISGKWHSTILWEVPLLAMISEAYYTIVDNWIYDPFEQKQKIDEKIKILSKAGCYFSDFGTRRRRNFEVHKNVVKNLLGCPYFLGTSNTYFASRYNINNIGTIAHEFIMGTSALESLAHANRYAFKNWFSFYKGKANIALTDTFTTDVFLNDFDGELLNQYSGVRHDSGNPRDFVDKIVNHYRYKGIDPSTKTIVFSDSLNAEKCVSIKKYCDHVGSGIKCVFGIGTSLTNDFNTKPLNIVIKLDSVAESQNSRCINVVKLSDDEGKETGDLQALKVAKYTFFGDAL